jgi:hypothetical protein
VATKGANKEVGRVARGRMAIVQGQRQLDGRATTWQEDGLGINGGGKHLRTETTAGTPAG